MPRISPVSIENASPAAAEQLEGIKKKLGSVPNFFGTLGNSSAALGTYLAQSQALEGALNAQLREQIALAVAGVNSCEYCAAAHTMIGKGAGLSEDETQRNLAGNSEDAKALAAITFARKLNQSHGNVTDADVQAVRDAGFSDAEVLEIIAVTTFNIFTNFVNIATQSDVDFPMVSNPATATA
ncbi:MAG: carboxymuconolactone decarboxylase family protein [Planctomycetota bacterium]